MEIPVITSKIRVSTAEAWVDAAHKQSSSVATLHVSINIRANGRRLLIHKIKGTQNYLSLEITFSNSPAYFPDPQYLTYSEELAGAHTCKSIMVYFNDKIITEIQKIQINQ